MSKKRVAPEGLKFCSYATCAAANPQPLGNFALNASEYDGVSRYCRVCTRIYNAAYREKNRERIRKVHKKHAQTAAFKATQDAYRRRNLDKSAAHTMKYFASKLGATPSWLSEEQRAEIREFYTLAKELAWLSEEPLEVDHIVPLQGKEVSGLHVPWNLQLLPRSMNRKKHRRLEPQKAA